MKPTTSNRGLKRPHESYEQSKTAEVDFKTKEDIANFLCCDSDDSDEIEDNKLLSKEGVRRLLRQNDIDADDDSESCTNIPEEEEHFNRPDEIEITPFNLDEELRDGNFDASGTYILNKNPDEIKDVWADSIDWAAIKKNEQTNPTIASTSQEVDKTSDDESNESKDKILYFKQMLRVMKPNETVKKTIRRLGDQIPKKSFKSKPTVKPEQPKLSAEEIDECKRKLDIMIESAHICLKLGDVDIYSKTFDDLEEAIDI